MKASFVVLFLISSSFTASANICEELRGSMRTDEEWVRKCHENCCFEMVDQLVEEGHLALETASLRDSLNLTIVNNQCSWNETKYLMQRGLRNFGIDSDIVAKLVAEDQMEALATLRESGLIVKSRDYEGLSEGEKSLFLNVDAELSPSVPALVNYHGRSAVRIAIKRHEAGLVKELIEMGADVNQISADGQTTLLQYAYFKDGPCFRVVADAGADLNLVNSEGKSILFDALAVNDLDLIQRLFSQSPKIDLFRTDREGRTPLFYACQRSSGEVICALLQELLKLNSSNHDLVINQLNIYGTAAPIHVIFRNPNSDHHAKTLLIQSGANVNLRAENGFTPIMAAAAQGTPEDLDFLIRNGASIHQTDANNLNALFYAIEGKNVKTLHHLLNNLGLKVETSEAPIHPLLFAIPHFNINVFLKLLENMNPHSNESKLAATLAADRLKCNERQILGKNKNVYDIVACQNLAKFQSKIFWSKK